LRGGQCFSGIKVVNHTAVWEPCSNSLMTFRRGSLAAHALDARQHWPE
jgi:hypothetical protein